MPVFLTTIDDGKLSAIIAGVMLLWYMTLGSLHISKCLGIKPEIILEIIHRSFKATNLIESDDVSHTCCLNIQFMNGAVVTPPQGEGP